MAKLRLIAMPLQGRNILRLFSVGLFVFGFSNASHAKPNVEIDCIGVIAELAPEVHERRAIDPLWAQYKQTGDVNLRNQLAERYLEFVRILDCEVGPDHRLLVVGSCESFDFSDVIRKEFARRFVLCARGRLAAPEIEGFVAIRVESRRTEEREELVVEARIHD